MLIFTHVIFLEYPVTNFSSFLINSDVLYPKDTSSPHSGVPAEVLCRGRDFVVSIKVLVAFKGKHCEGRQGEAFLGGHSIAKLFCSPAVRCFLQGSCLCFSPEGVVTGLPWECWCGLTFSDHLSLAAFIPL